METPKRPRDRRDVRYKEETEPLDFFFPSFRFVLLVFR